MKQGRLKRLADKYRPLCLAMIFLLCYFVSSGQYNPTTGTVSNKPYAPAQAVPTDSRSYFYDATNFLFRPYQSASEVYSYLNLPKYRTGNFIIVIDSGGTLLPNGTYINAHNTFWEFRDTTSNAGLLEMNLFGGGGCGGCLLAVNNLSDLSNAGLARSNLGLGSMSQEFITATSTDISGSWPNTLTVNSIQGHNLSYLTNYANLTNTPPLLSLTTTGTSGVSTYNPSTGVLNIPNYSVSGGACLNCNADTIGHVPLNFTSFCNHCVLTIDTVAGYAYWAPVSGGGATIPPNIGTGFRIYSPQVPGFRSLVCASGCTIDSTTNSNSLTFTITASGTGTVTLFSAVNIAGFATQGVTNATTTPQLTYTLVNAPGYNIWGNNTASSAAPIYFAPSFSILNQWASGTIALLGNVQTFTAANTFTGGVSLGSSVTFSADNTWSIGASLNGAAIVWARTFESNSQLTLQSAASSIISLNSGGSNGVSVLNSGQIVGRQYTSSSAFPGTAVAVAGFDASGNMITISPTFTVPAVQGLHASVTGDSVELGGFFFMPDTIATLGYAFDITGLPSFATLSAGDSILIEKNGTKQLALVPSSAIGGSGGSQTLQQVFTQQNAAILTVSDTIDANTNSVPLVMKGAFIPSGNALYTLGNGTNNFLSVNTAQVQSNHNLAFGVGSAFSYSFNVNGLQIFGLANTGQAQLNNYTTTTSFTGGTPVGLFSFDNTGKVYPIALGTGLSFSSQTLNGNLGTVTSVAETVPATLLTISGSPITTSGTFALGLATQSANTVFGNFTGSTATPTFGKVNLASMATNTANTLVGFDGSGNPADITAGTNVTISGGVISATGGGSSMVDATYFMPVIQEYNYGTGLISSANVTGYTAPSIDNVPFPFVSNGNGVGTEQGGWVVASTSGDSVLVSWPTGVAIGASIVAGHVAHISRLESSPYNLSYPDSAGQFTYYWDSLTGYHWYNQGIGGQTMAQVRARFLRDACGKVSDPNDGRNGTTIPHPPRIIVLCGDAALNSVYAGVSDSAIEQDMQWCAQQAAYNNIPMVVTTVIGDGSGETVAFMQEIMRINDWLMKGGLNEFGVTPVDVMGRWASGIYNNVMLGGGLYNNPVNSPQYPSSLVTGGLVHFSIPGYDSVALDIFNRAHLPVIDSVVLTSAIAATNPIANLNRVTTARFSNTITYVANHNPFNGAFLLTFPNNAVAATATNGAIFGDSVWIEVNASTNVTGSSTQSGISSVLTHINNNPSNQQWYKKPIPHADNTPNMVATSMNITVAGRGNTIYPFQVFNYDNSSALAIQSNTGASNAKLFVNGNTPISGFGAGGTINACNTSSAAFGFSTLGAISAPGTGPGNVGSTIGAFDIGGTANTGISYGIEVIPGKGFDFQISSGAYSAVANGNALITVENSNATLPSVSTTPSGLLIGFNVALPFGNNTSSSPTIWAAAIDNTENDTAHAGTNKIWINLAAIAHIRNSINTTTSDFMADSADTWLNPTKGNVLVGSTTGITTSKFSVVSTTQGAIPMPSMTTTQQNAIGTPAEGLQIYDNVLHVPAYYNGSAWVDAPTSGTYTPTLTGTLNVAASSVQTTNYYTIVNGIVTVNVGGTVTPTASGTACQFTLTLPVNSTSANGIVVGSGSWAVTSSAGTAATVVTNSSTTVQVTFYATSTSLATFSATFVYHN